MTHTYELIGGPLDGEQHQRENDHYPGDLILDFAGRKVRYACTCVMSVVRTTGLYGGHAIYRYRGVVEAS